MSDIYESMCSIENLLQAYQRARRANPQSKEVLSFGYDLEANVLALHSELIRGRYQHGSYREFIVNDSKRRLIKAATFRDRVVHQAVYAALEPTFERSFIFDSYACRKGKGTHAALERLESWIVHSSEKYVLACDISKFFASVDHVRLTALIARRVRDVRMYGLCRIIIESVQDKTGVGIPIGNLTSQLFANIYMNELDQYAKHTLKARHYIRYMDDFLIFGDESKALHRTKETIATFLGEQLGLTLHPKKAVVFPVSTGVNFLGYRVFQHHRRLRPSTVHRFVARVKRQQILLASGVLAPETFAAGLRSWSAYADKAASRGLKRSLAARLDMSFAPLSMHQLPAY